MPQSNRTANTGPAIVYGLTLYAPASDPPISHAKLDGAYLLRVRQALDASQQVIAHELVLPPLEPGQISILDLSASGHPEMPQLGPVDTEPSFWAAWDPASRVLKFGVQNPYFPGTLENYALRCSTFAGKQVLVVRKDGSDDAGSSASLVHVGSQGEFTYAFERDKAFSDITVCAAASVEQVKTFPDGVIVGLAEAIVSGSPADFDGFFYVQQQDRSSGIRVAAPAYTVTGLVLGSRVSVLGRIGSTTSGEREITEPLVVVR